MKEWKVNFNREGRPGTELPVGKYFHWAGKQYCIPAVYLCEEGLVLDLCTEIDKETERAFLKKWEQKIACGLSRQEQRQISAENPLNRNVHCHLIVNGVQMQNWHSNGSFWLPEDVRPETEDYGSSSEEYLEHYGLDCEQVWSFQRFFYPWNGNTQQLEELEALLCMPAQEFAGESFPMPEVGKSVAIVNPVTAQSHDLTVKEIQHESITIPERFAEYDMPTRATVMVYTLEPDLSHDAFQLRDTQERDQARKKDGTPYYAGSVGMMLRLPRDGTHAAASSMRFCEPETVVWEPVFRIKTVEDLTVKII